MKTDVQLKSRPDPRQVFPALRQNFSFRQSKAKWINIEFSCKIHILEIRGFKTLRNYQRLNHIVKHYLISGPIIYLQRWRWWQRWWRWLPCSEYPVSRPIADSGLPDVCHQYLSYRNVAPLRESNDNRNKNYEDKYKYNSDDDAMLVNYELEEFRPSVWRICWSDTRSW